MRDKTVIHKTSPPNSKNLLSTYFCLFAVQWRILLCNGDLLCNIDELNNADHLCT